MIWHNDPQLLQEISAGDELAFCPLHCRIAAPFLKAYITSILRDPVATMEVVQQ